MNALIYTAKDCPHCAVAKRLLTSAGVKWVERDVTGNAELITEMMGVSNDATTVPQIILNDEHIGGCDDLIEMVREGKLRAKSA